MPKRKRESSKQTSIKVGNISDVRGNVNIAAGNIATHQTTTGLSAAEIEQLFEQLYAKIEARPETSAADKEGLKAKVQKIQSTVTAAAKENKEVNEGFLMRRFRNIARMAPDLLEVIVTTFANPPAGLAIAVKKIAEQAKTTATS